MPEEEKVVVQKRRPIRKFFKSFVNVRKWVSYDEVSVNAKNTLSMFRRLVSRPSKDEVRVETYEEAIARLDLNPMQVLARKRNFLYSAMIYLAFALGFAVYFIYLLVNLNLVAAFLTTILIVLMSLAAYREHFWYMQMQKQKLGCTFRDWLGFVLRR